MFIHVGQQGVVDSVGHPVCVFVGQAVRLGSLGAHRERRFMRVEALAAEELQVWTEERLQRVEGLAKEGRQGTVDIRAAVQDHRLPRAPLRLVARTMSASHARCRSAADVGASVPLGAIDSSDASRKVVELHWSFTAPLLHWYSYCAGLEV